MNSELNLYDLPSEREFVARLVATGLVILVIAVAIAVSVTWYTTRSYDPEIHNQALRTSIALPLLIVPICTSIVGLQAWHMHRRMLVVTELARTDAMTGLANRRAFMRAADDMFQTTDFEYAGLSILIVDLDHFKQVNDVHGHDAGDEVLIHASAQIKNAMPDQALVARLGGEEFGILLPYRTVAELHELAEAIRFHVAAHPCEYREQHIQVSASVGVGIAHRRDTVSSVMSRADDALYEAKDKGRNRFVVAAA